MFFRKLETSQVIMSWTCGEFLQNCYIDSLLLELLALVVTEQT